MTDDINPILIIERECLGSCLFDPVAADRAVAIVEPRDFLDPTHQQVFGAIQRLVLARESPDATTVAAELAGRVLASEILGYELLVTSGAYAAPRARLILAASKRRQMARLASELASLTSDSSVTLDAPDAAVERAQEVLADVLSRVPGRKPVNIADAEPELMGRMEANSPIPRGMPTGFPDIDRSLGGLRDGEFIVVGARPSIGKSLFGANVGEHVSLDLAQPYPVLFFSLEMSKEAIYRRFLFGRAAVDVDYALSGNLSPAEIAALRETHNTAKAAKWFVHDEPSLDVRRAHIIARQFTATHGKCLIIVDYLQLMTAAGERRFDMLTNVSGGLKHMARDLQCPVIALAQVSRAVDTKECPELSDLRECGAIEQDADVIIFLARDKLLMEPHPVDVYIAKNRPAKTGRTQILFDTLGPRMRSLSRVEKFS